MKRNGKRLIVALLAVIMTTALCANVALGDAPLLDGVWERYDDGKYVYEIALRNLADGGLAGVNYGANMDNTVETDGFTLGFPYYAIGYALMHSPVKFNGTFSNADGTRIDSVDGKTYLTKREDGETASITRNILEWEFCGDHRFEYAVSGGIQLNPEYVSHMNMDEIYAVASRGETISVRAHHSRTYGDYDHRPSILKAYVSSTKYANEGTVFDSREVELVGGEGDVSLEFTIPEGYADKWVYIAAEFTSGHNFAGYPYGADTIGRVIASYYVCGEGANQYDGALSAPDEPAQYPTNGGMDIAGAWLSPPYEDGTHIYWELRTDGTFTVSQAVHDSQYTGTPENWGDPYWIVNETRSGKYEMHGDVLTGIIDYDVYTMTVRVDGDMLYAVDDESGEEVDFELIERYASAPMSGTGSPFGGQARATSADVLWTNGNIGAVDKGARDYYVMFELPDCVVTEIETYHYLSDGKAPGLLTLYGEDGSTYGPFQAEGRDGQGGVKNAYWVATVELTLPAGRYAIEDGDPATWSSNGETDGWGMATIRGTEKARTGNPFKGN